MNRTAYHTYHGKERHMQRFRLPMARLRDILDSKGYYPINRDPGILREYRLVYNNYTNQFIVVVQNHYTGKIITVWPTRYYERMIKRIPKEAYEHAKDAYDKAVELLNEPDCSKFIVSCRYNNKVKPLGTIGSKQFDNNMDLLKTDEKFLDFVHNQIGENKFDISRISWVSVKPENNTNQFKVFNIQDGELVE